VWYGGLREWRKKIDEWKTSLANLNLERWMGSTDTKLDMLSGSVEELKGSIEGLKTTVEIIKETIERETMDGMVSRHSPLVASEKAIEVLKRVNLMSEIDKNCDFILAEVDKKSKLFIYTDLKTPEERITEIAPSIVHELIKAGKIEEKKVDLALKELEKIFGANAATYYGVLLLITAYILEKRRKEGELNKALEVCQKALQIFDRIEDQRGVATAYHQSRIPLNHREQNDGCETKFPLS